MPPKMPIKVPPKSVANNKSLPPKKVIPCTILQPQTNIEENEYADIEKRIEDSALQEISIGTTTADTYGMARSNNVHFFQESPDLQPSEDMSDLQICREGNEFSHPLMFGKSKDLLENVLDIEDLDQAAEVFDMGADDLQEVNQFIQSPATSNYYPQKRDQYIQSPSIKKLKTVRKRISDTERTRSTQTRQYDTQQYPCTYYRPDPSCDICGNRTTGHHRHVAVGMNGAQGYWTFRENFDPPSPYLVENEYVYGRTNPGRPVQIIERHSCNLLPCFEWDEYYSGYIVGHDWGRQQQPMPRPKLPWYPLMYFFQTYE